MVALDKGKVAQQRRNGIPKFRMVDDLIAKARRTVGKAVARHKQVRKRLTQVHAFLDDEIPGDFQAKGRQRLIVNESIGCSAKLGGKARRDVGQRDVIFGQHVLNELLLLVRKVAIDIRVAAVTQICVHIAQVVVANRLRFHAVLVRIALGKLLAR